MKIEAVKATEEFKSTLYNLFELYSHDFSQYVDIELNEEGRFENKRFTPNFLDLYWKNPEYCPFLIRVDGKLAGFVLVNKKTHIAKDAWSIAEFFVVKKYRHRGVGSKVALQIFKLFPGNWEVAELGTNQPAINFWRKVINDFTQGNFKETTTQKGQWTIFVQTFD